MKKEADKETDNKADKKAKPQISKREREVLLRKLHARLHFGNTRMTLDALKDAYGIDFDDACSVPCDACAWAKAKHAPVSKTSTRKAARVGARLHYDVFTAGARSDSGCKYMLVVVHQIPPCPGSNTMSHKDSFACYQAFYLEQSIPASSSSSI